MSVDTSPLSFERMGPAKGSRIVVTGGRGGMGRRLVEVLHGAGVALAVLDLPASLERYPVPDGVPAIAYDARSVRGTDRAFENVAALWDGRIDGLVHFPGFMTPNLTLEDLPVDDWDEILDVNLRSAYLVAKRTLPMLRKAGGGAIVLVASGLATLVEKGTGAYSASKAGIIALTKGLAKENAPDIRANAIAPGAVDTAFLRGGTGRGGDESNEQVFTKDMDHAKMLATIPMGRIAVVDDVIGPILFLLGEHSRFMTGQTLYINGGRLMV